VILFLCSTNILLANEALNDEEFINRGEAPKLSIRTQHKKEDWRGFWEGLKAIPAEAKEDFPNAWKDLKEPMLITWFELKKLFGA